MFAPGTRVGPYELVSLIGEGGMGQVYRARDPRLARDVAIKVLARDAVHDANALARFEREARAVAALAHPNIVSIHDFGDYLGTFFVVTELLEGETLREKIRTMPLNWRKAVDIGAEIADGLSAAHAKWIVHRDLKPENVFMTSDGRLKILDFGLAQTNALTTANDDQATVPTTKFETDTGKIVGTLGYMSPEQLRGDHVDPTADIFSLGCILYELVTSKRPFERTSGAATIAAVLKEEAPREALSDAAPPEFQRVVEGCLEKEPRQRFQSARDLALTLRAIASSASMPSPVGRGRRAGKSIDSIAVLPFVNAGNDPNADYLCDGLTEGIINKLSQLPKLKVMARSTVFRYKQSHADAQSIGRELRVRAVLSGRVQEVGERLAINVELVDSADGSQLWGELYNRQLADLLAVQEEMSREIAEKLRLRLTGAEKKRLKRVSTTNSEAYQLYLKGRYQWNKRTEESLRKGITFFRQAIDSDPSFASAYAGLADSFVTLATNIPLLPRDAMPKAKAAAMRAIEIDDGLAEAWASLAAVKWWFDWDWKGAEDAYRRAIERNPNYATAHDGYAMLLCARGRFDEAVEQITKAADLDPLSLIIAVHAGWPKFFARDYDGAIRAFRNALELDAHFIPAHGWLGMALGQQQRYAEALASFDDALSVDRVTILLAMRAHTLALAGKRGEAEAILTALREEAKGRYVSPYDLAVVGAALGDRDRALTTLRAACDDRSAWMVFVNVDPRLDGLRDAAEFAAIARRLA